MASSETGKFIGCILSVKTKPGPHGEVKNIVGTVKDIDVGSDEQSIILDDAMSNGLILPDGYRLRSSQIADLTVIGRTDGCVDDDEDGASGPASSSVHSFSMASSASNIKTKPTSHVPVQHNSNYLSASNSEEDEQQQLNQVNISLSSSKAIKVSNVAKAQVGGNGGIVPGGNVLLNSLTCATASFNQQEQDKSPKIAKPKPRKPQQPSQTSQQGVPQSGVTGSVQVVYSSSTLPPWHGASNRQNNTPKSTLESLMNVQSYSVATKENILTQTFGSLISSTPKNPNSFTGISSGGGVPLNGASLFNTLASAAAANSTGGQIIVNELKSSVTDKKTHQQQLGGVLNQLVSRGAEVNGETKLNKNLNPAAPFEIKSPRGKPNAYNSKGPKTNESNGDTFAMSKTDMKEEFDFEGSNSNFVKLPVAPKKETQVPVPLARNGSRPTDPVFTAEDTTLLAERMVESVTLRGTGVVASKRFVTDTGVAIPAVDVSKRSMILNLAHDVGLDHSRMIETMARAVVQTCLPIFGDAYRLSPEREEDRPWILICAGPHWQGAVGTAAARVMASLGVRTVVHSPKEELTVCAREEKLYRLTGESFTRRLSDIGNRRFELVIMALDDHLSTSLTLKPFSRWLNNTSVVFVDPPMVSSYKDSLEQVLGKGNVGSKVGVVCPALPLAYGNETSVKFYLVNLGIPHGVYLKNDILYKSPFGDKLVVQIFSLKQVKIKQKEASQ